MRFVCLFLPFFISFLLFVIFIFLFFFHAFFLHFILSLSDIYYINCKSHLSAMANSAPISHIFTILKRAAYTTMPKLLICHMFFCSLRMQLSKNNLKQLKNVVILVVFFFLASSLPFIRYFFFHLVFSQFPQFFLHFTLPHLSPYYFKEKSHSSGIINSAHIFLI